MGILASGHYCHDTIISRDGKISRTLGGSVAYISSVLEALGSEFRIASKVGEDFLYDARVLASPYVAKGFPTTAFLADFRGGERIGKLEAVCEAIFAADIPDERFQVGLACGIAGELLPETLVRIGECCDAVVCDIQGLIRATDSQGKVIHRPLSQTGFCGLLDRITYLKASTQEALYLDIEDARRRTTLIITEGDRGCRILDAAGEIRIPAIKVEEVDPTGAGDCFLAGFAHALVGGANLLEAAQVANRCGALAVTQLGVPDFRQNRELVACL